MAGLFYLLFFLICGMLITRWWLPGRRPPVRWYAGASLGLLCMMWLPALWAYLIAYTVTALLLSVLTMGLVVMAAYLTRDPAPRVRLCAEDRRVLRAVLLVAVPLTLVAAWLQYTHSIRPAADGTYHVGQSTYGDLSLHLAVTTSIVNAKFPLQNSLMVGATMAYPYLADSFAATLYMLGLSLPAAMAVTGTVMCFLVFAGYALLCAQLARRRGAVWLATLLLFFNGGLGFFYTLGGTVENGVVTTAWDHLKTVMEGYYKTPTNQPDPNNLRWVNILCDMLVPQRGILGGWTMLMPALNLLLPPLARRRKLPPRAMILAGVIAGGLPLLHTHTFLALALASLGFLLYALVTAPRGRRAEVLRPFLLYGAVAAALALPQLINLTFVQATSSDHFLRFQFNWCNNRGGAGLVDPYFWFYIKNIGLPYLLILLALLEFRKGDLRAEADRAAARDAGLPDADATDLPQTQAQPADAEATGQPAIEAPAGENAQPSAGDAQPFTGNGQVLADAAGIATDSLNRGDSPLPAAQPSSATAGLEVRAAAGAVDGAGAPEGASRTSALDAAPQEPARRSVFAHDMPAYGQSRLNTVEDIEPLTPQMPYVRPLPPEKLRAAAFSPDDSDRVGVMRAVTGSAGQEASRRPLLEEIFHSSYRADRAAEAEARAQLTTPGEPETCFADQPPARDWVRRNRLLAAGAFLILLVAELFLFQPNEYDNNKLIYVWFLLCLPMAADYTLGLFTRLKGMGGRRALAALFLTACFLSAGLTVAREAVSDYQAYSREDIAVAAFVKENTPEHSVFLTGTQHLNPVASLAGRTIVCGSDLYLYYHGFTTTGRKQEVQAFYEAPADHLDLLKRYGVAYVYLSPSEWYQYKVDAETLRSLLPVVYESENGAYVVFSVPDTLRAADASAVQPAPTVTPDPATNPASPG
ncbi:MAG: hypothetical protein GX418_06670 [Clostridiales bacterium]|nr:hypothetical protein [Clostridiales bacterium]